MDHLAGREEVRWLWDRSTPVSCVKVDQAAGREEVRLEPDRSREERRVRDDQASGRGPERPEMLAREREVSAVREERAEGRGPAGLLNALPLRSRVAREDSWGSAFRKTSRGMVRLVPASSSPVTVPLLLHVTPNQAPEHGSVPGIQVSSAAGLPS